MTELLHSKNIFKIRWLILSYISNADGRASSLHIDNRIPCLMEIGIKPILLSGPSYPKHSNLLHSRVPSLFPSGVLFELRTSINRFVKYKLIRNVIKFICLVLLLPFYLIEKAIVDIESQWSWCFLAAMRGSRLIKKHNIDIIYSTGGSMSSHLAAWYLSRGNNLPWVAELQDPLVHEDWRRSRRALTVCKKIENVICDHADAVIFMTDMARARACERTSLGKRGKVVYPGAAPVFSSQDKYSKGEFCRFVHLGSLGWTRNLQIFLCALGLYLQENAAMIPLIRLELYGTCDNVSKDLISRFPYCEVIKDCGRVSHRESLAIMRKADILLLIQDREAFSSETIPSKCYEYMITERPILGLVHQNMELSQMLNDLGHRSVEATNVEGVKNAISLMVQQWRSESFVLKTSPFTVSDAVNKLVEIAENTSKSQRFAKEDANAGQ